MKVTSNKFFFHFHRKGSVTDAVEKNKTSAYLFVHLISNLFLFLFEL